MWRIFQDNQLLNCTSICLSYAINNFISILLNMSKFDFLIFGTPIVNLSYFNNTTYCSQPVTNSFNQHCVVTFHLNTSESSSPSQFQSFKNSSSFNVEDIIHTLL
ncbi:hypothetical protein V6Z12_A04G050900 [Gossypium hirsutum]